MTIGREQSDFSQGDLVFRGRIRVPTSGRIDHLRHLQDRAEFQRRLDAEGELRKALTRLFPLPGAADGTEGYRHPRNPPRQKVTMLSALSRLIPVARYIFKPLASALMVQRSIGSHRPVCQMQAVYRTSSRMNSSNVIEVYSSGEFPGG